MAKKPKDPKDCTHFELLIELVPDMEERLKVAQKERPDLFETIRRYAVETEEGFRPLHWWQGCM